MLEERLADMKREGDNSRNVEVNWQILMMI